MKICTYINVLKNSNMDKHQKNTYYVIREIKRKKLVKVMFLEYSCYSEFIL